jgi:hypothetical protein
MLHNESVPTSRITTALSQDYGIISRIDRSLIHNVTTAYKVNRVPDKISLS